MSTKRITLLRRKILIGPKVLKHKKMQRKQEMNTVYCEINKMSKKRCGH